jgi:hypothetical protein
VTKDSILFATLKFAKKFTKKMSPSKQWHFFGQIFGSLQNKKREDVFNPKDVFWQILCKNQKVAKKENTSSKLSNIIQSTRNILLGIND